MLDIVNTLGISNTLMRLIERRTAQVRGGEGRGGEGRGCDVAEFLMQNVYCAVLTKLMPTITGDGVHAVDFL